MILALGSTNWTLPMRESEGYLQDKLLVDVAFGHGGLEVRALQETQKKLVHQLTEAQTRSDETPFSVCGMVYMFSFQEWDEKIDLSVCGVKPLVSLEVLLYLQTGKGQP